MEDRHDLDCVVTTVPEGHPPIADAKPVLRLTEPAKPLDAASARLFRFVPQVRLKSSPYVGSNVRTKRLKVFDGFGGQNNIERHFG